MTRHRQGLNVWPGFVDALATLLLVTVFVLVVVVLAQFPLSMANNNRQHLEAQVATLQTALERSPDDGHVARLQQALDTTQARLQRFARLLARYQQELAQTHSDLAQREAHLQQLHQDNRGLREELAGQRADLQLASTLIDARSEQLAALRAELQQHESSVAGFRSRFLSQLYQSLADHPNIQIVGDRFLLQAEILFASGSATLGAGGRTELANLAKELHAITSKLPEPLNWVLQVGGHTDNRPIHTAAFPSNWALSSARALAIVEFLIEAGIPPERLAATGYGEFQPLNPADTPEAWRENRRIELKFTSR